ncbi:MAG: DUF4190 domain-containing protein [Verrucomicrobiota bacterium]
MNRLTPPVQQKTSGLSVASMVLGILGLCTGVTALPAIICGHLGLRGIKRSQGQITGGGMAIAGLILGYLMLLVLGFFALVVVGANKAGEKAEAASRLPFGFEEFETPAFPERPSFEPLGEARVRVGSVTLDGAGGPGSDMTLWIYLPDGEVPEGSLKCVLNAPAGTNLLSGADVGSLDLAPYHDESLPYAEAGMAVVRYSIDGVVEDEDDDEEIGAGYEAFRAAKAGLVNTRLALEYVLARLPEVDSGAIYSAGHSSAGTLSLLAGVHESRLAGCIAYAPAADLEDHFTELLEVPLIGVAFPGVEHFVRRSSPMTHVDAFKVPVFLFHAEDDMMAPIEKTREFAEALEASGKEVELLEVESGGHYGSMISTGIPKGIEWIEGR